MLIAVGPSPGSTHPFLSITLVFREVGQKLGDRCPKFTGRATVAGLELPLAHAARDDNKEGYCLPMYWVGDASPFIEKMRQPYEIVLSIEGDEERFAFEGLHAPISIVPVDEIPKTIRPEARIRFNLDLPSEIRLALTGSAQPNVPVLITWVEVNHAQVESLSVWRVGAAGELDSGPGRENPITVGFPGPGSPLVKGPKQFVFYMESSITCDGPILCSFKLVDELARFDFTWLI